jgi:hypothetical protein
MNARIIRLPVRSCIWIVEDSDCAPWLVLAPGGHGWAHGQKENAEADARWLSENFNMPIRSAAS